MKKYILSLVLVLGLFVSVGKVFAQTPTLPDRTKIQDSYLTAKYGSSTLIHAPENVFIFLVAGRPIRISEWITIQSDIETQYQKALTDYQTYVQSLMDAKNACDNNLQVSGQQVTSLQGSGQDSSQTISALQNKIVDLENTNLDLTVQVTNLKAQVETIKNVPKTSEKIQGISKVKTNSLPLVKTLSVPVISSTPEPVATPVPVVVPPQKSWWQKFLDWIHL